MLYEEGDIFVVEWGAESQAGKAEKKKNGMKFSVNIIEKGQLAENPFQNLINFAK